MRCPLRPAALLTLLTMGWLGCGSSAPASAPVAVTTTAAPSAAPTPSADAGDAAGAPKRPGPPATAAPIATTGAAPSSAGGDYEITFGDCVDLVANFERRLRQDEMARLDAQKLGGKALAAGLATVDEVVAQGVENWRGQCQSIVGTVQVRSRIRCAIAAETRARFEGCWDGQFDGE